MLKRLILFVLLTFSLFAQVSAQTSPTDDTSPTDGYFLAPDSDGVIQVWHWGESPTMLTSASASIVDFAVSHDRLSVAYTSGGQLWLDRLQEAEPYVIADIDPEASSSAYPVFSPDDQLLAYSSHGIWIYPLDGSADPRQLIKNVQFDPDTTTDVGTLRYYSANQFIADNTWLMVTFGIWEGSGVGLLNVETGESVESQALFAHDKLLSLVDGRLLVYGNDLRGGDTNIEITTPDKLNERTVLLDLTEVTTDTPVYVSQIEEIEPGLLRVMATTFGIEGPQGLSMLMTFDYDLTANALVGELQHIYPPESEDVDGQRHTSVGKLSPDGAWMSMYLNATLETALDGRGIITGELVLYEIATGELIRLDGFTSVSSFRW